MTGIKNTDDMLVIGGSCSSFLKRGPGTAGCLKMDYHRIYRQLIERACKRRLDCYSEWHHIFPRSLGGGDEKANLVQLTYREHFLAHWLLTKLFKGRARRSMVFAFVAMGMSVNGQRIISSWRFDIIKRVVKDRLLDDRMRKVLKKLEIERVKQIRLYGQMFPENVKIGEIVKIRNGLYVREPIYGIAEQGMELISTLRNNPDAMKDAVTRLLRTDSAAKKAQRGGGRTLRGEDRLIQSPFFGR